MHEDTAQRVSAAIRSLREGFKESQEQFARRLGTTVRTIARYEAGSLPPGKMLAQLEQIALQRGIEEWSEETVFRDALLEELGITYFSGQSPAIFSTMDESLHTAALLLAKRSADPAYNSSGPYKYEKEWESIKAALRKPLKELQDALMRIDMGLHLLHKHAAAGISPKPQFGTAYDLFQRVWPVIPVKSDASKLIFCRGCLQLLAQGLRPPELAQRFLLRNYEAARNLSELLESLRGFTLKELE